jgi:hypothetical protein
MELVLGFGHVQDMETEILSAVLHIKLRYLNAHGLAVLGELVLMVFKLGHVLLLLLDVVGVTLIRPLELVLRSAPVAQLMAHLPLLLLLLDYVQVVMLPMFQPVEIGGSGLVEVNHVLPQTLTLLLKLLLLPLKCLPLPDQDLVLILLRSGYSGSALPDSQLL